MNKPAMALTLLMMVVGLAACDTNAPDAAAPATEADATAGSPASLVAVAGAEQRFGIYAPVSLTADLSGLSDEQRRMIGLLIEASEVMDRLFWLQAYGEPQPFLDAIADADTRAFAVINYGPWDRLDGDKPFIAGVEEKSPGAQFYPADMTREEFAAADIKDKDGLYSLVRRDDDGKLYTVPYHETYATELAVAAGLLRQAAELASDPGFANYLRLRADALVSDNYQPSDMAWLDMKNNEIDVVIGAIETYEDQLFGYRAAYESYVLLKDLQWSERLQRYAAFLPQLQRALPVDAAYKKESPGTDSDLNAYEVLYYAGHSNAGSKTIAINLPNDEQVQLAKGTRRLQLKNAMRAKFDEILVPIAETLIVPEQRDNVTFNAFFSNTMFHEVAHGLGIKNTITDNGTVRAALQELASPMEEGKADVLGLWMITWLTEQGELPEEQLMDHYVTFLAGIFRSSRFGASSAHGRANMMRFNFFDEVGAFERNEEGQYQVNFETMQQAVEALSRRILVLQGDGDYAATKALMDDMGVVRPNLQVDLDRLNSQGIPVDIEFKQGKSTLGL
ncbi:MAG: Zn-dependent hydrolase [Gammaproteobacteria bacterium]|nr:Zn-dependent hydrolase [Gammaproteobacteria bacterium]